MCVIGISIYSRLVYDSFTTQPRRNFLISVPKALVQKNVQIYYFFFIYASAREIFYEKVSFCNKKQIILNFEF